MLFESLAERLQETLHKLRSKGKLSEADVKEALSEVRRALLAADVHFTIAKTFVTRIEERLVGEEVMESLTPGQQVVKVVHEELTRLMGQEEARLQLAPQPPTVVMLVGLQGSGKTTSAAKLARHLQQQGRQPFLVAADVYRPAAIEQLSVLAEEIDVPVFSQRGSSDPVALAGNALGEARRLGRDVVILDTAGRLHIDDDMMAELSRTRQQIPVHETLLVVDAMTGQDAVSVAEAFQEQLGLDGIILTKLDGDARGGAALSVRQASGSPIKFVGSGERLDRFERFHPERMASRILGMGDVLTLIERAGDQLDAEQAQRMEQRIRRAEFTFDDFLDQLAQLKQMGPLQEVLGMIPGLNRMPGLKKLDLDERELDRVEAMITSMTRGERANPDLINASRRRRIANGSGTSVQEVNRLLKQFKQTRKMIKQLGGKGKKAGMGLGGPGTPFPFQ